MSPDRNVGVVRHLPALVLLLSAAVASAQAPPAGEWKLFQEFNFLTGSWSGPAESGGRIGGRVVSFGLEVDGATLGYRATTYYPRQGQPARGAQRRDRQDRLRRREGEVRRPRRLLDESLGNLRRRGPSGRIYPLHGT